MLTAIVRQSLRYPWLVLLGAFTLLAGGIITLRHAPFDVFPEFVPPQASVQTEVPGFTPLQVEQLVTRPLEAVINGANGVETVRSETIQGLSVINITFKDGSDPYRARQQVAEALADASGRLPAGASAPRLTPLVSSTMDLLKIGLVSDRLSPMELRELAEWTVRPRLLAARGVARVNVFGGDERRIEVRVRPDALLAHGLVLSDLATAVSRAVAVNGGGFADTHNQRILIDPGNSATTARDVAQAVLSRGAGGTLHLGDVAEVVDTPAPRFGDALVMGRPGVLLTVSSQYGANTLDATAAVEKAIAELKPALAGRGVTLYPALHRPANFIETALSGIGRDLLVGAAMIALVLFAFMRRWKVVLIAFLSIPLSLVAALLVLNAFGMTINVMTLGGLAVALGVVIDDAIVDIENILRRLREAGAANNDPATRRAIIEQASVEVRAPVVYATFVLGLTMLPVVLLSGLHGAFFAPLGLSFLLAVMASLVVALTVMPAFCLLLLGHDEHAPEPDLLARFKARHQAWVERLCVHPARAGWAVALIGVVTLGGFMLLSSELLPAFREQHYVVGIKGPPGASFDWMRTTGQRISRQMLAIPQVLSVEEQIGRSEAGEDTWPPSQGEFHVRLKPVSAAGEDEALAAIRKVLADTPGIESETTTFLGDRIGESLSGETAAISVSVHGTDLDELDRVAAQVAGVLSATPGAVEVRVKSQPGAPVLGVTLDPARMALHGVSAGDAGEAIRATFAGLTAGQISLPDRTLDVAISVPPALRQDPEALGDVLVRGYGGSAVRLRDIATISLGTARATIEHEGGQRRQVVTANVANGGNAGQIVASAQEKIAAGVKLPPGVYLSWSGTAEGQAAASRQLLIHVALTAIGMVALLVLAFGGLRPAILVLAGLPLAMAGGVVAVALTGGVVSLGALVGFITLFGISARNAILLIAHADHLVAEEGAAWSLATVLQASRERVTPILLTALVTGFALVPLALETGQAGREIQGPMALVILGGLLSSLLLTLLLLPALIWRWRMPAHGTIITNADA